MSTLTLNKHPENHHEVQDIYSKSSKSALMQDIYTKVIEIAKTEKHVIIIGEIGSGKTELAHFIHSKSPRASGPFHTFYCLDIDENEYKKAFWEQLYFEEEHIVIKYDLLEKAGHGTLYLAQFSDLDDSLMTKIIDSFIKGCNQLYRFKKEAIPRLILSLNMEAYQRIVQSKTWKKLLDLINPITTMPPPLRERKEDIPMIIERFIEEIKASGSEWGNLNISAEAVHTCSTYDWPGNIRQLRNAIQQGAILSRGTTIQKRHLPFSMSWNLPYSTGNYT